jgi:hypothetical protein
MMLSINICIAHPIDLFEDGCVSFGGSTNSCCYSKPFQGPLSWYPYWDVLLNQNWDYLEKMTVEHECLHGGLDFTKDDENVNSQSN